jgi:alpha-galactosidase
VYLSDLEEHEFVGNDGLHTIDLYKDRGYGDKPIHMAGRDFKKGLVTTPVVVPEGVLARATYVLDGPLAAVRRFKAQVGIDASDSSGMGSCVFMVEVRQGGQWKRLFESGMVKSKEPPRNVDVEISGADRLRLVVTDGGDGGTGDIAAWADAMLQ